MCRLAASIRRQAIDAATKEITFYDCRDALWDFVKVRLNSTRDNYIKII